MVFSENGIDLKNWKSALDTSSELSDSKTFVQNMIDMNLSNSIFIDNTADSTIPELYEKYLAQVFLLRRLIK